MANFKKYVTSVTTTKYELKVTREILLDALGIFDDGSVQVFFSVPGGGDYSNCDLDLDNKDMVVTVKYQTVEESDQ